MATLIPALGSCAGRMTAGERRLAERLEDKLEDDYLLWYDVPVGPKQTQPDFVVLHPHRGVAAATTLTLIINLPTLPEQAAKVAELLHNVHQEVHAWGDMAVLCRNAKTRDLCASTLAKRGLPVQKPLGLKRLRSIGQHREGS